MVGMGSPVRFRRRLHTNQQLRPGTTPGLSHRPGCALGPACYLRAIAEPAVFAHRVTVDRAHGGQGLGAELLDWAGTKAADEGVDWLRVDVWTTNEHLQHYYLRQQFTYVRTVVLVHNPSRGAVPTTSPAGADATTS
jgi:GNAT superfamily N-acetyltransferase